MNIWQFSNWPNELREAGYEGKPEVSEMLQALTEVRYLRLVKSGSLWGADATNLEETLPEISDNITQSAEESLAKLMIEHPELWRKCPR